jgi:hypothetical protein
VAFVGAIAIAIAPSVAPPAHTSAERAVTLVAETQPVTVGLVTDQGLDDLTAAYDAARPSLDYGVALALWAGRFLPIPGAALYHFSVAYETLVDPVTYSLVHNFGAFIGGDIELAVALNNIAVDAVGAVVDFATTELNGHAGVVPPADAPNAGAEPWVRWIITAAVSPLYYLPVPNALTVDQVSFLGRLAGTMVSSAIDNLEQVTSNRLTPGQALANLWAALTDVALPELAAQERALFLPPAPPAGAAIDPESALGHRIATIDGAAPLSAANAAAPLALVPTLPVQEELALSAEPVGVDAEPVGVDAEPVGVDAEPVGVDAEPVGVDSDPVGLDAVPVEPESEPATGAAASTRAAVPKVLSDSPSPNEAVSGRTAVEHEPPIRAGDRSPETVKPDKPRRLAGEINSPSRATVPSTRPVKPAAGRAESAGVAPKTDHDEGHGTDEGATQGEAAA